MSALNQEQKRLIFDYAIGILTGQHADQAAKLINSTKEAAQIYQNVKGSLAPLESLSSYDNCPDDLAERTVLLLNNAARSGESGLERLLEAEKKIPHSNAGFWPKIGEMLATAAVIALVAGVIIGPVRLMRHHSWQMKCKKQLSSIWQGLNNYSNDHDGQFPAVAMQQGQPWWKVGYQGNENLSNTRHLWLLARKDYVSPTSFVCPGKRQGLVVQFNPENAQQYKDFPSRRYVTYSFRIRCRKPDYSASAERVLMSDMNPLFESIPQDYSKQFRIELNEKLRNANSPNHAGRGQNVLFGDGSVDFSKARRLDRTDDDIFTLRNKRVYQGIEFPTSESDAFVAP